MKKQNWLLPLCAAALVAGMPAGAQTISCAGQGACTEVSSFTARITDLRTSLGGRYRIVTANIQFQNKTAAPLTLAYVQNSGVVVDDQGNRYGIIGPVRGMGEVAGNNVDAKFVLRPGEASDARFEFGWEPTRGAIIGTSFALEMTVREVEAIGNSNQLRLGREHALQFARMGSGAVASAPMGNQPVVAGNAAAAPAAPAAPEAPAAPVAPMADPCAGKERCFASGPFVAEIAQFTPSEAGRNHVLEINVRFRNVTNQPIILGYVAASSSVTDDQGNRFYWGTAGTHDTSAKGIGIVEARNANTTFVLRPGETRSATFGLFRRPDRRPIGTSYTWDATIAELEVLANGQQVRTVREHSMNFQNLRAGGAANLQDAAEKLRGIFSGKKK